MQARLVGVSLSSEKLDPEGLYLLENGVDALIYIGKEAPQRVIQDLLGESQLPTLCWVINIGLILLSGSHCYNVKRDATDGAVSYQLSFHCSRVDTTLANLSKARVHFVSAQIEG